MRKYLVALMSGFVITASVSLAQAGNVGLSLGINLGNFPAPGYAAPPVAIEEQPEFVAQPSLGLYMAVGTPYDLFYAAERYYLCRGNIWYEAPYYNGPWVKVGFGALPWGLRRYPIAKLRYFRDEACRHRGADRNYEGRHFRPEGGGGEERQARWEGGRHGMMGH